MILKFEVTTTNCIHLKYRGSFEKRDCWETNSCFNLVSNLNRRQENETCR